MVEEQVEVEVLAVDLQVDLLADEREPGAKLQQEPADVVEQAPLDVAFGGVFAQGEEIEVVWSLSNCAARSDWGLGRVDLKLLIDLPWRP